MTSTAPFRNPPPGPPDDPTWMMLDGRDGWPMASGWTDLVVSPLDCALVLKSLPGGPSALADPSGRFGGLVPPPNVALGPDGCVWLLDLGRGKLRRFDDCACAFVDAAVHRRTGTWRAAARRAGRRWPCAETTSWFWTAARRPAAGRVLVFASHGFALARHLAPPPGAVAAPWRPSAIAVAPDGRTFVADIANGALHVFDRGGAWRAAWLGFGAVSALAIDRFGRLVHRRAWRAVRQHLDAARRGDRPGDRRR